MSFNSSLLLIIVAGLMNGSFVIPTKYAQGFSNEKIWFYHSIIGLTLIPSLILILLFPETIKNYLSLQPKFLLFLIFSGVIFGLGQVFFAYAIEAIGVALSFTINLSIGVTIGSIFVLFDNDLFFTSQGYLATLAAFFILGSLIIYYFSFKNKKSNFYKLGLYYHKGWLLACLTGLTSGLQNITFIIVAFHAIVQSQSNNSFWVWPPFLLAAAIPMFFGFLYRMKKSSRVTFPHPTIVKPLIIKNMSLIALMGMCFTGSLALYSSGMSQLDHQQQIVGWPAFMIAIILTCQTWGWFYKEYRSIATKNKFGLLCSVLLLAIAMIILAFGR